MFIKVTRITKFGSLEMVAIPIDSIGYVVEENKNRCEIYFKKGQKPESIIYTSMSVNETIDEVIDKCEQVVHKWYTNVLF